MAIIDDYPESTVKRQVVRAENRLRHEQVDGLFRNLARYESEHDDLDDLEVGAKFRAMKKLARANLAAWRQFRTKNGISNELLEGRYIYT